MARNEETRFDHDYDTRRLSEDTSALDAALFAALGEVDALKTDSENDFFKKKGNPHRYAGLPITVETLEPIFRAHGIMVIQGSAKDGSYLEEGERPVVLHLTHELRHVESGQFRLYTLSLPLKSQDPQQLGSAITYGRRYLWQLIAGAIVEDDDANTNVFGAKSKSQAKRLSSQGAGAYTGKSKPAKKANATDDDEDETPAPKKTLAGKFGKGKKTTPKKTTKRSLPKTTKPDEDDSVYDVDPADAQ